MFISGILSFIWVMIKLILALSIITIVHELGHFLIAKLLKIKVNEFSIGFGPSITGFKRKETLYSFRWILLGGYNALEGENENSEDPRAYSNQPGWKKLLVLIMGSTFNLILAGLILVIIGLCLQFPSTTIKEFYRSPATNASAVEDAGLQIGDTIKKVNGKKVTLYNEINEIVLKDKKFIITFERAGKEYETSVENPVKKVSLIGVAIIEDSEGQNSIQFIEPGKQAMAAGLKAGDKIIEVNGNKVKTTFEVVYELYSILDKPIDIVILRDDKEQKITIQKGEIVDYFDVGFAPETLALKPLEKVKYALVNAGDIFKQVLAMYKKLFTGKAGVNQLSGIVGVGEVVSQSQDIWDFLNLIAVISLSVGLMNLLPIPPMDGGKIVMVVIEMITRKKIPEKIEGIISMIFFFLLILLTLYVTWNDIMRIF